MRKKYIRLIVAAVALAMCIIPFGAFADIGEYPQGVNSVTSRFSICEFDNNEALFSMLSEDGSLIIHVSEDTVIYFEDGIIVYDLMVDGQTLEDVLDGRNMTVTYDISLRSYPGQTTPVSIMILYEVAVPLPEGLVAFPEGFAFTDVKSSDWYYTPVVWAFTNEIMQGINATEFAPNGVMTRAMLVTVLWRYAGKPEAGDAGFADVAAGEWYSEAVAWAAENEIVLGYNEMTFGVEDQINREQMYTILYRYMNFAGLTIALDEEMRLPQFDDDEDISDWASEAVYFMFDAGIMFNEGSMGSSAKPQNDALRGEIAGAMYFFDMYAK